LRLVEGVEGVEEKVEEVEVVERKMRGNPSLRL
jgi:hypothetical protein